MHTISTAPRRLAPLGAALFVLASGGLAWAHKPAFGPGFASAETAFEVVDNDVSIVVYQPVSCEEPQTWLTFEAVAGEALWVQLGVPEIARLTDYRPAVAVFAPGLPRLEGLPFEAPEGLGGVLLDAAEVEEPDAFYEEFTRTASWVWAEEWVETPESGRGYVVAFEPEGWTGKVWVATGTVEDFSDVDFADFGAWDELVNDFHETGKYGDPPEVDEVQCALGAEEGLGGEGEAVASAGCESVSAGLLGGWVWLAGLLGLRRRPRGLGDWMRSVGHEDLDTPASQAA